VLASGDGTHSGDSDQVRPEVAWEIAPLRAVALRTERAVNQRWQTLRAAILGSAVLLGVIGSAAAVSLMAGPSVPGGMGFLSAMEVSSADSTLTADEARDGVAGSPTEPSAPPQPPAGSDQPVEEPQSVPAGAPPAPEPEPTRGTPTAEPLPEPAPAPTTAPAPNPSPSQPGEPADAADEDGIIGDLIDILLPGLFP
jgi:hypothetical protein